MEKFLNLKNPEEVYRDVINPVNPIATIETLSLEKSIGKVLAEDIFAPEEYPDFPRSTVDGFAVKAKDVFGASHNDPVYLIKKGIINTGEDVSFSLQEGETYEIATGAMVPNGSDAVVMREYARDSGENIEIIKGVASGENVLKVGDDIKKGSLIVRKGSEISAGIPGLLSAFGIYKLQVYSPLNVHIYSSGDEVVLPQEIKTKGKIRDVNTYNLFSLLDKENVDYQYKGRLKDDLNIFKEAFKKSLNEADLVVVSGGSSKSAKDYTETAINSLGEPGVVVHGLLISPGKPSIVGEVNNKFIFGLPGHPTSCFVVSFLFLLPLIRKLAGMNDFLPKSITVPLKGSVYAKTSKETYILGKLESDGAVSPLPTDSPLVSPLSYSDGLIRIPLGTEGKENGDYVQFFLWRI